MKSDLNLDSLMISEVKAICYVFHHFKNDKYS